METLAGFARVHENTVRNVERTGTTNLDTAVALAEALGATVGELLGETDPTHVIDVIEATFPGWKALRSEQRVVINQIIRALGRAEADSSTAYPLDERPARLRVAEDGAASDAAIAETRRRIAQSEPPARGAQPTPRTRRGRQQ